MALPKAVGLAAVTAAVLLTGCTAGPRDSAGQVTAETTTDSYSVQVGDCLAKLPIEGATQLSILPCGEEHYWEVYAVAELEGTTYPGDTTIRKQASQSCTERFEAFVGLPAKKSTLEINLLTPTAETWESASDRQVTCLVGRAAGGVTGTLAGSQK